MERYRPLARHLSEQTALTVTLSFDEIERIIKAKLPKAAHQLGWWLDESTKSGFGAITSWVFTGYVVTEVDAERGSVAFSTTDRHRAMLLYLEQERRLRIRDMIKPAFEDYEMLLPGAVKGKPDDEEDSGVGRDALFLTSKPKPYWSGGKEPEGWNDAAVLLAKAVSIHVELLRSAQEAEQFDDLDDRLGDDRYAMADLKASFPYFDVEYRRLLRRARAKCKSAPARRALLVGAAYELTARPKDARAMMVGDKLLAYYCQSIGAQTALKVRGGKGAAKGKKEEVHRLLAVHQKDFKARLTALALAEDEPNWKARVPELVNYLAKTHAIDARKRTPFKVEHQRRRLRVRATVKEVEDDLRAGLRVNAGTK